MRLAVTGANGFVGRHVVHHGVREGWDAVGLVRSEAGARVVEEAGGRPVLVPEPEVEGLTRALNGADAVVHLAQIGAERGEATYEAVNVALTRSVLEAAGQADVPRIVYFSGLGVARYGMSRRSTNPYFLSKLAAENLLFQSDREGVVFRPSYVVGPGDAFVRSVLEDLADGEIETPGDGSYRMQPIAVTDAADLVLAAARRPAGAFPTVFDLVGPEEVSYTRLLERLESVARREGRPGRLAVRQISLAEADQRAREGGFQGMLPDELDCLLCDEVGDPSPLVTLLGRDLTPLDAALVAAIRAA